VRRKLQTRWRARHPLFWLCGKHFDDLAANGVGWRNVEKLCGAQTRCGQNEVAAPTRPWSLPAPA
jgi:hypothetical protein